MVSNLGRRFGFRGWTSGEGTRGTWPPVTTETGCVVAAETTRHCCPGLYVHDLA